MSSKAFLNRQQIYEKRYRKRIYRYLQSVNYAVAKAIEQSQNTNIDINAYIKPNIINKIYLDLYKYITIQEAKIGYSELPGVKKKDIIDDLADLLSGFNEDAVPIRLWRGLIDEFVQVRIASRITEVDTTTRDRIARLIERGLEDGLGADEVARMIRRDINYNRNRSLAIARTETITSMNQGKFLAAKSSPYVMEKAWSPTIDARTRITHASMNRNNFIPLDSSFEVGFEYALYPCGEGLSAKETVNCRCSLITRAKRGENGRLIRKR